MERILRVERPFVKHPSDLPGCPRRVGAQGERNERPRRAMYALLEVFAAEEEGQAYDHSRDHYPTIPQSKADGQESDG